MNLEDRVQHLIKNNLQWDTPYIPPIIINKRASRCGAFIDFYKKSETPYLLIHDRRTNETYSSQYVPSRLVINADSLNLTDETLDNILLHELCHWYTMSKYGNVESHGYEFTRSGRTIGLNPVFNQARVPASCLIYKQGFSAPASKPKKKTALVCPVCGKVQYRTLTRKQLTLFEQNPRILSDCHNTMLVKQMINA